MTNDNNDRSGPPKGLSAQNRHVPDGDDRLEPRIDSFDDDLENYEEPDRDTDFSSGYRAEEVADEAALDDLRQTDESLYDTPEYNPSTGQEAAGANEPLEPTTVDEDEPWYEEEYLEEEDRGAGWPLQLIIVAAIALVILGIGAYGVLQERAAAQEELRELRATLATSVSQDEIQGDREALRDLQRSNSELAARAEALAQENRMLQGAIADLEASLTAPPPSPAPDRKPAKSVAEPVKAAAPTREKSEKAPPPKSMKSATSEGSWFVNFGSYSSKATAETWAARLKPASGNVVVIAAAKDGKTYYRVRVIGLGSRAAGNKVARGLEAELGVSQLWVGRD